MEIGPLRDDTIWLDMKGISKQGETGKQGSGLPTESSLNRWLHYSEELSR